MKTTFRTTITVDIQPKQYQTWSTLYAKGLLREHFSKTDNRAKVEEVYSSYKGKTWKNETGAMFFQNHLCTSYTKEIEKRVLQALREDSRMQKQLSTLFEHAFQLYLNEHRTLHKSNNALFVEELLNWNIPLIEKTLESWIKKHDPWREGQKKTWADKMEKEWLKIQKTLQKPETPSM